MPYYGSQGQEIEDGEWDNMRRDERESKRSMETKWIYVRSEPRLWTVGFYDASYEWHTDSDHEAKSAAADRAAFLNGSMVEIVPAEPTITLTRAQAVALFRNSLPLHICDRLHERSDREPDRMALDVIRGLVWHAREFCATIEHPELEGVIVEALTPKNVPPPPSTPTHCEKCGGSEVEYGVCGVCQGGER